ncbi:heavy-metal-associated domain-containing protein [Bacillus fonticola]|uniref:heavy-metal-associated domain-containing protein n=1 Tax=Bacillus fonticola TaxID=2728853 RepID=UPI0014747D76|nr:heavy metal-associated domain-containing protein [Bacillus fonticola]
MEDGLIKVEGMTNEHDAEKVLHALNEVWGVRKAEVSLSNQTASFRYNEKAASYEDFLQAVEDTGFTIEEGDSR